MLATMAQTVIQESTNNSHFGQKFLLNELGLPPRKPPTGFPQAGLLSHCFVGDEAFPLSVDLIKPYPRGQRGTKLVEDKLVFNYQLSHARRIVECAFGILVQCFRVFDHRMYLSDENGTIVMKACTVLHNYLTPPHTDYQSIMDRLNPEGRQYNENQSALRNVHNYHGHHSPTDAAMVQDWYKAYFWSPVGGTALSNGENKRTVELYSLYKAMYVAPELTSVK